MHNHVLNDLFYRYGGSIAKQSEVVKIPFATFCMRLCKQTRIQTQMPQQSFGVQLAPKTHSLAGTQQQTSPTNRLGIALMGGDALRDFMG